MACGLASTWERFERVPLQMRPHILFSLAGRQADWPVGLSSYEQVHSPEVPGMGSHNLISKHVQEAGMMPAKN